MSGRVVGNVDGVRAALTEALRFTAAPLAEIGRRAMLLGDNRLIADVRRAELALSQQQDLPVAERVRQLQRLAELQAGELGQPNEAFDTLAQALTLDPTLPAVADAVEKVALANGLDVQLVALYRILSSRPNAPVELARRLARRVGEIVPPRLPRGDGSSSYGLATRRPRRRSRTALPKEAAKPSVRTHCGPSSRTSRPRTSNRVCVCCARSWPWPAIPVSGPSSSARF